MEPRLPACFSELRDSAGNRRQKAEHLTWQKSRQYGNGYSGAGFLVSLREPNELVALI
jgi:hypothetical protein